MLASDSLPTSTSLLTRLYRATELHNDSMCTNDNYGSIMTLVNTHFHAQMIYSILMTAHMLSFIRSLSLPTATGGECSGFDGHT